MSFYTYAGEEDTCEECGKTFTHAPEYAYKAYFKKGKTYKLYYFCSWKCLQKYRRRKEENQEKPDHYENKPRKQMVRGAKLNAEKAKEIRRLYADGNCTQQALAAKYHVSVSTVHCVISAGKAECIDCLKLLLTEALRQYGYPADVGELSVKYVE